MVITTGWIAVQRDVYIDFKFNLEQYSLDIKTDSTLGSNHKVDVYFYTSQVHLVGYLSLYFYSTPQYYIGGCSSDNTNFPTDLPTATDKVWRVTLTRTSGIRQLVVHCNGVEVLNTLMSGTTCDDREWSDYWSGEVAKIKFTASDTASDFYKPVKPGNCVYVIQHLKSKIRR